jgi:GNAT superfamily N-acetyltransferase
MTARHGLFFVFGTVFCLLAQCVSAYAAKNRLLSPALPIIGNQRLELAVPNGWRVRLVPGEAWNYASYRFDLVAVAPQHDRKVIGVEVLMHAIGRARRHGDLNGTSFKTTGGLYGIEHHASYSADHGDWYFCVPYSKTESAIIVRVMISNGKIEESRKVVHSLFRSVRFLEVSKSKAAKP